jgi:transcriptional regulator of nitric oxide reductase
MRVGLLSLVLCAAAYPARAQNVSPQQRQAILDYQLTLPAAEHLITAMQAMTSYLISLPDYQDRIRKSAAMTGAERVAQLEGDPKAAAILKQNSLTARDYLIGVPALRMALMAAQGATSPNIVASAANLAFAKANLAQLKPKMDAADGLRR